MPGSSPTMERRLFVSRLKSVDLPTLGRPTMATSGSAAAPGVLGTTDLRYFPKTCLQSPIAKNGAHRRASIPNSFHAIQIEDPVAAHNRDSELQCLSCHQSIEGVAVMQWQHSCSNHVLNPRFQKFIARGKNRPVELL